MVLYSVSTFTTHKQPPGVECMSRRIGADIAAAFRCQPWPSLTPTADAAAAQKEVFVDPCSRWAAPSERHMLMCACERERAQDRRASTRDRESKEWVSLCECIKSA